MLFTQNTIPIDMQKVIEEQNQDIFVRCVYIY